MLTVAYLANRFPVPVEPYVSEEVEELRSRGIRVVAGSVLKLRREDRVLTTRCASELVLQPPRGMVLLRAAWLCVRRWKQISPLVGRVLFRGGEGPLRRAKSLIHTWLGACYAVRLEARGIEHIHVHHGFFGSWIAMVAARLLGIKFSMTLHGSDLLLHPAYLDVKFECCAFCLTVSEYNRHYALRRYPEIEPEKVIVSRLGVEVPEQVPSATPSLPVTGEPFTLLAVGRLHAVKDHAFLVRACALLRERGVQFECSIAGEGPERRSLQRLIRRCGLEQQVSLLGHVPRDQMDSLYDRADVVVLTSRSEGIPLVLMEAMARSKVVLAPDITGIPELVIPGRTGFLYHAGSLDDFVDRLLFIRSLTEAQRRPDLHPYSSLVAARQLDWVRYGARVQIRHNFSRKKNLETFAGLFIARIAGQIESLPHENFVLQQI